MSPLRHAGFLSLSVPACCVGVCSLHTAQALAKECVDPETLAPDEPQEEVMFLLSPSLEGHQLATETPMPSAKHRHLPELERQVTDQKWPPPSGQL